VTITDEDEGVKVQYAGEAKAETQEKRGQVEEMILTTLSEGEHSRQDLLKRGEPLKASKNLIDEVVKLLEETGQIRSTKQGREKVYRLEKNHSHSLSGTTSPTALTAPRRHWPQALARRTPGSMPLTSSSAPRSGTPSPNRFLS